MLGNIPEIIQKHLSILLNSIEQVKRDYLWFCIDKDYDSSMPIEQVERTFTYELYRQWANTLETTKNNDQYHINSEIQKIVSSDIKKVIENKQYCNRKYPDFVLHRSQEKFDEEHQLILCEVKRHNANDDGVKKDFNTFLTFMNGESFQYPYAYCVYIFLGTEKEMIKNINKNISSMKSCFEETRYHALINKPNEAKLSSRVLCISYRQNKENTAKPTICTLEKILQKNN